MVKALITAFLMLVSPFGISESIAQSLDVNGVRLEIELGNDKDKQDILCPETRIYSRDCWEDEERDRSPQPGRTRGRRRNSEIIIDRRDNERGEIHPKASANGKYHTLLQTVYCPENASTYGNFEDHGSSHVTQWCGETTTPGYWVWHVDTWYIWEAIASSEDDRDVYIDDHSVSDKASAYGKYSGLKQVLYCPQNKHRYGPYTDHGKWDGERWCEQEATPGFWVYFRDSWYIWDYKEGQRYYP